MLFYICMLKSHFLINVFLKYVISLEKQYLWQYFVYGQIEELISTANSA